MILYRETAVRKCSVLLVRMNLNMMNPATTKLQIVNNSIIWYTEHIK